MTDGLEGFNVSTLAEVKSVGMQILDPVLSNPIFTPATYDSWLAVFDRTNPTSQPRPRTKLDRKGASELSGVDWTVFFFALSTVFGYTFYPFSLSRLALPGVVRDTRGLASRLAELTQSIVRRFVGGELEGV